MPAPRSQLVLISAAAALVVGVVVYGTAGSSHGSPTAVSTPSLSPAELSATKTRVVAWLSTPAGNHLTQLSDAMEALNGKTDSTEITQDCDAISAAVSTAQGDPPIPDGPSQAHRALALEAVQRGALSCSAGAERGDANGVGIGVYSLKEGMAEINALTARLAVLADAP